MIHRFGRRLRDSTAVLGLTLSLGPSVMPNANAVPASSTGSLHEPDGMIDLVLAPEEQFEGRIFLINDWDGGDADN